jgi:glycosyltransferase involved in cell wall biosynthesis
MHLGAPAGATFRACDRVVLGKMAAVPADPLRILHAVRAPVGGIFRHILDLAQGQIERGHQVGILADSLTGGERADAALAELKPRLALGVHRIPIHREPRPNDALLLLKFASLIRRLKPNVLHGHGAKAGVFMRTKGYSESMIRVYTPHGGSLHYGLDTLKGRFYASLERALMSRTDLFLFESEFARNTYQRVVGTPKSLVRCVFNGVTATEFDPLVTAEDATSVVYVGEFRHIKGADILIEAVARLRAQGKQVTLTLAGDGEETATLHALCDKLNLGPAARFIGHVKARFGFSKGRLLVVPSRGDSMPYVVIEAAAAGIPMLAANVGGIPEILGPFTDALVTPNDPNALAAAIAAALDDPTKAAERAKLLRERVFMHFSQRAMVEGVLAGYRAAFAEH